MLIFK